jgi:ribosomal protein L7/L12
MNRYWLVGIVVVLLLAYLSRRAERADSTRKLIRNGSNPPSTTDIDGLLHAGRKIEAIKRYRELHGVDLKAAKDAVDARARELGR